MRAFSSETRRSGGLRHVADYPRRLRRVRGALSHVRHLLGLQRDRRLALLVGDRRAEQHDRVAEAQDVAVAQRALLRDALAVQVGAVARPVVDERPALLGAEQLRVAARDLVVPGERDVVVRRAGRR